MKIASVFYHANIGDLYCNNMFWTENFDNVNVVPISKIGTDENEPVIFGGGGYFLNSNMKVLISQLLKLKRNNIPFGMVGVGDQWLSDQYYHYLARILVDARLVTVRDIYSYQKLEYYGLKDNLYYVPDILWNLKPKQTMVTLS